MDVKWRADFVPRFQREAPGAARDLCGVKGDWAEHVGRAVAEGRVRLGAFGQDPLPESFDSAAQWPACAKLIGDIRDQSNCGCCWAFAGAEAASDRMCISTNASIVVPLSAEDVCFCASDDGCGGGFIQQPWMYIMDDGAVAGGQYHGTGPFGSLCKDFSLPHCHHHGPQGDDPYPAEGAPGCPSATSPQCPTACDGSDDHQAYMNEKYTFTGLIETAKGEESIQRAIFEGGPVETAFTVFEDFENYAGGIYHNVLGSQVGGHAVKMVGWGVEEGTKYWKIANSWNPHWGEKGYFRMLRGSNECNVEANVVYTSPSAKWHKRDPRGPCSDVSKHCSLYESACHHPNIAGMCRMTCGCCGEAAPAFCPNATAVTV